MKNGETKKRAVTIAKGIFSRQMKNIKKPKCIKTHLIIANFGKYG
jgi:hypothetical protein